MRKFTVAALTAFVAVIALLLAFAPPGQNLSSLSTSRGVSDSTQTQMLASDQRMLEEMRVSAPPHMETMIARDTMWIDPEMIRLQEEHQAQIDRMLARRP